MYVFKKAERSGVRKLEINKNISFAYEKESQDKSQENQLGEKWFGVG